MGLLMHKKEHSSIVWIVIEIFVIFVVTAFLLILVYPIQSIYIIIRKYLDKKPTTKVSKQMGNEMLTMSVLFGGKCQFASMCKNYEHVGYTCNFSHDEYNHSCFKKEVKK